MITLQQGDCLELMKNIEAKSVDLVLTDPPYGTTACKWDSVIPFEPMWEQINRIAKDNAAIILFSAQPFTTRLISSNLKHFRYCWYWKKNNVTGFSYARYQPMRCIEDLCVFYKQMPSYKPQGLVKVEKPRTRKPKAKIDGVYSSKSLLNEYTQQYTNYPKHLLEFKNEAASNKNRLHPTQKPVDLLEYIIKTYTNEGETVLDFTMGSGSTGVACVNTRRKFKGIELDKNYYNIAKQRIENAAFSFQKKCNETP